MEEAEILCDDIAIIDRGKIIARGTPEGLLQKYCSGVTLKIPRKSLPENPDDFLRVTKKIGLTDKAVELPHHFEFFTREADTVLERLVEMQVDLSNITLRSKNLEDLFLELTGRQLRH